MNLEQDLEDTGKEKITVMLGQNRWSGCVVSVSDVEKNDGTPVVFRIFDGVESRDIALQNFFWKQLSDGLAKVSGHVSTKGGGLTATMPGKIVSWHIKAGQAVKVGEPMVVIEAMKMEHTLKVPFDGKVKEIFYQVGEQILEGVQLVDLDRSSV
jgi:biotin carboxyl carrier protein